MTNGFMRGMVFLSEGSFVYIMVGATKIYVNEPAKEKERNILTRPASPCFGLILVIRLLFFAENWERRLKIGGGRGGLGGWPEAGCKRRSHTRNLYVHIPSMG